MIRFLTFLGFAFLCHITMAQNNSPYAIFGDHSKMLDATSCRQTSFSTHVVSAEGDTCLLTFDLRKQLATLYNTKKKQTIQYYINNTTKARFLTIDPNAEDYPSTSPYAYCLNNPINLIDPDGRSVYMLLYTVGNGTEDDNMFRAAAETRMKDIMSSKGYNPKLDIVIMKGISDLGKISDIVSNIVSTYSEQYGATAEFGLWSHSGLDGPIGTVPTSNNPLETIQMNMQGWGNIDFNWENNASAYFYGCRSGVSSNGYSSFTTDLSALQNFHNVNVYGQSSYSYPSIYTNRRETNLNMIQGTFSYPTYMVGGYKGDGARAFFQGVHSPSMRKSNNGHGHLGGYYQRGRRY
jgi:hypothetical protein